MSENFTQKTFSGLPFNFYRLSILSTIQIAQFIKWIDALSSLFISISFDLIRFNLNLNQNQHQRIKCQMLFFKTVLLIFYLSILNSFFIDSADKHTLTVMVFRWLKSWANERQSAHTHTHNIFSLSIYREFLIVCLQQTTKRKYR